MSKEQRSFDDVLQELDAGIFVNKVQESLKQVALGVVNHNKKGVVTINLEIERIGDTDSVKIKHTVKYSQPTKRGKLTEDNTTTTPMHVNRMGELSINQQSQNDLFNNSNPVSHIREVK